MKTVVFTLVMILASTNSFASNCPLDFFNKLSTIKCPNSLIEKTSSVEKANKEEFIKELNKNETIKEIYIDVLQNLNDIENVEEYINPNSLKDLAETEIFGRLLSAKALNNRDKYLSLLEKISPYNKYWCTSLMEDSK